MHTRRSGRLAGRRPVHNRRRQAGRRGAEPARLSFEFEFVCHRGRICFRAERRGDSVSAGGRHAGI